MPGTGLECETPVKKVVGGVSSGWVGLQWKSTISPLAQLITFSRNWFSWREGGSPSRVSQGPMQKMKDLVNGDVETG